MADLIDLGSLSLVSSGRWERAGEWRAHDSPAADPAIEEALHQKERSAVCTQLACMLIPPLGVPCPQSAFASLPAKQWKENDVQDFIKSIEMDSLLPKLAENDVGEPRFCRCCMHADILLVC